MRRFRFGSEVKFLNGFKLKVNANLVRGRPNGPPRELNAWTWDELTLSYSQSDVLDLTKRASPTAATRLAMGHESHTSSKKIKTVERSNMPTTFTVLTVRLVTAAAKKAESWLLQLFSTDQERSSLQWGSMSQGSAFYLSSAWELHGGNLLFDFLHDV